MKIARFFAILALSAFTFIAIGSTSEAGRQHSGCPNGYLYSDRLNVCYMENDSAVAGGGGFGRGQAKPGSCGDIMWENAYGGQCLHLHRAQSQCMSGYRLSTRLNRCFLLLGKNPNTCPQAVMYDAQYRQCLLVRELSGAR